MTPETVKWQLWRPKFWRKIVPQSSANSWETFVAELCYELRLITNRAPVSGVGSAFVSCRHICLIIMSHSLIFCFVSQINFIWFDLNIRVFYWNKTQWFWRRLKRKSWGEGTVSLYSSFGLPSVAVSPYNIAHSESDQRYYSFITLAIFGRFSKFFQRLIQQGIHFCHVSHHIFTT